jgi:hypothetical protein
MFAHLARCLALTGFMASVLVSRTVASKILLPIEEPTLECNETTASLDRDASPLDSWIHPYGEASSPFADQRGNVRGLSVGMWRVPTSLDWWSKDLSAGRRFRVADPHRFVLLRRYTTQTGRERFRPAALLWAARFAPERFSLVPELSWRPAFDSVFSASTVGQLATAAPLAAPAMLQRKCPTWARPRPVVVTSWGSDYDRLTLVDCDGNIDVDALDRISVLARIMGQRRPDLPLPDSPSPPAEWPDEWVNGVRLLHPRLLWILQRFGEAFPKHTIHILSGYRRDARESSPHRLGRAFDLSVRGVPKEQLFAFCMSLTDVGCGYYPYHPFVHVDVRPFGSPKIYWVDDSQPGEHSNYVDSWPGVIEGGALIGADSE